MAKATDGSKKKNGSTDKKANKLNKAAKSSKVNKLNKANIPNKANKLNKAKKAKYKNGLAEHKYTTFLYKVILAAILAVVFYPPYFRGLFFENDYIKAELFVFIIFAVFWVYKLLKKEKLVFKTPIDYASFGFVVVYLLSLFAAAGLHLAVEEWLKYCMYFSVFFMLTDLAAEYKNRIRVMWVITFSAVGISLLGIDAAAGGNIVRLVNNFFDRLYLMFGMDIPEKGTFFALFVGGRINSTLQYPNTLAAYLMAAFLVAIGLMLLSDSRVKRIIASCAGFIFFVTFVFTLSRGAYIILPFMLILFIVVLPKGSRTKGTVYAVVPLIASIPAIIKILGLINSGTEGNTAVWLWVLSGVVLCLILTLVSEHVISFFERLSWKIYISFIGTIFVIACIGAAFILSQKEPLTISFPEDSQAGNASVMRSVILKPDKEYRLSFDVVRGNKQGSEADYMVYIFSNTEKEIITSRPNMISSISGKATSESVKKDMDFMVPAGSKILYLYFYNTTKDTDITFDKCLITDMETGKVKNVTLKYRYIPELIVSRLQDIQINQSSIVRGVFYKDGLKMFGDHWLIGAGGGAWSLLYFSYQSYLYFSTQAHNYFLQLAVETGIIGLLILLFLLVSIIYIFIRQRYNRGVIYGKTVILQGVFFTILITLFLHAGIDFDFSFPAMLLLMWEILALFNAGVKETAAQNGGFHLLYIKEMKFRPAILLIITFLFAIRTIMALAAESNSDAGLKALNDNRLDSSIGYFKNAAELNPLKPEYKINYSTLVVKKEKITADEKTRAGKWISEAESICRNDVTLLPHVAKYYFSITNISKSLKLLEKAVSIRTFRAEEWEQLTGAYNSAWQYYLQKKNDEQSNEMVKRALSIIPWAAKENKRNMDPFIFNPTTSRMLEQFSYYRVNEKNDVLTGRESIAFYSLPGMDIDGNGIPDQWNTTASNAFILKNENNILIVDKVSIEQDSYIQSRLLELKPKTQYRIDLTLDKQNEPSGIRYAITGVTAQATPLESVNGVYSADVTTPEQVGNNYLLLYFDKSCIIKSLSITEIK